MGWPITLPPSAIPANAAASHRVPVAKLSPSIAGTPLPFGLRTRDAGSSPRINPQPDYSSTPRESPVFTRRGALRLSATGCGVTGLANARPGRGVVGSARAFPRATPSGGMDKAREEGGWFAWVRRGGDRTC